MQQESMKGRIVRTLRGTDEPALSAKNLAEELDVSVRTINNHLPELIDEERIETTQIGNATAYYIPHEDLPSHKKPEHCCKRCGRTTSHNDFAKLEHETYFEGGNIESGTADFAILCRFCYLDYISWIHNDEGSMGDYPYVHSWHIPEKQLLEVREDSAIDTCPRMAGLQELEQELYDMVKDMSSEEPVAVNDIESKARDMNISADTVEPLLRNLAKKGFFYQTTKGIGMAYLPSK